MAGEKIPAWFSLPMPEEVNPACAGVNRETENWATALGLGTPALRAAIAASDVGYCAARALPRAEPAAVRLFSDFIFWFFVLDEICDNNQAGTSPGELAGLFSRLIRVAEHPDTSTAEDSLADGLGDIIGRVAARADERYLLGFIQALRTSFLADVWEASYRERTAQAAVEDYVLLRIHNACIQFFCMFLEIGGRATMSTAERDTPAVRALIEMASFVMNFDNDVISYDMERDEQRYSMNAITVLRDNERMELPAAVEEVLRWRNLALQRFIEVRDHLTIGASAGLADFLANLGSLIRAAFDWSIQTSRYRRRDGTVDARETQTRPEIEPRPLPFSTTAWWWITDLTGRQAAS